MKMATETETSKARKTERAYFNAAGEETKRPTADTIGFRIKDTGPGNTGQELRRKFEEYKESIQNCAKAFGFMTVLGNTIGKKDSSFEDLLARDETFMAGEWAEAGESGPRISVLAQAIVRAAKSEGRELTVDAVSEKLKAMDDAARKSMKDDPSIALAFAEIQQEAAKERVKALKATAKENGGKSSALANF
jgi:hypothetical protein